MHDNQLDISAAVVRALIDRQFPQWRSLPVRPVAATGTVNAIFRIGDRYTARFPLEAGDADTVRRSLEAEAEAAAELAGRTRFPTPEPIALGEPGAGYPLPWSVQTWLPGTVATDADPGDSAAFALDLAEFIAAVRSIPTRGRTFSGRGRGGDLHDHDDWLETCFLRSEGMLDVPRLRRRWAALRDLPRGDAAGRHEPRRPDAGQRARLARPPAGRGPRRRRAPGRRPRPRPGERLAPARRRAAAGAARIARLGRPGVGARPGVGVPAVDGPGLVLRRQQPGDGRNRTAHPRPPDGRPAAVTRAASPDAPIQVPGGAAGSYQAMVAGTVVVVGGSGSCVYGRG